MDVVTFSGLLTSFVGRIYGSCGLNGCVVGGSIGESSPIFPITISPVPNAKSVAALLSAIRYQNAKLLAVGIEYPKTTMFPTF